MKLGPELHHHRDTFTPDSTFGIVRVVEGNRYLFETVERERDHNRASTKDKPGACIPAGRYLWKRVDSPTHGDCFQAEDVPDRQYIQIHSANWSKQLRGCIAPGLKRASTDVDPDPEMVESSRAALKVLMDLMAGCDAFWMTTTDATPED